MIRTRLVFFAVCALSLTSRVAEADWVQHGPSPLNSGGGGRVSAVAPHPTNSDILYVGAASGGVWKREGGTWTSLTDDLPSGSIGAVAIDPKNTDVIYAGSGEGTARLDYGTHVFYGLGLYKSTDGGQSWTIYAADTFSGRAFTEILIHPENTDTLFAGIVGVGEPKGHPGRDGPTGLFRSDDGGETWSRVTELPETPCTDIAFAPDDPSTMYAAMGSINGDAGIYKSTDGGETWSKLGGGAPSGSNKYRIAVAPSDPSRIWAFSDAGRVYRSDDAGGSWQSFSPDIRCQGWYDVCVAVDPNDPDRAYFGGVSAVRTTNAGQSFQGVTPNHSDVQQLVFDADDRLIAGTDGGVHVSTDGGGDWQSIGGGGLHNIQFYPGLSTHPTDETFMLGGLQDNGSARRTGSGDDLSWRGVLGGDGGYTGVHPDQPSIAFAEIYGAGAIYRSTDGGSNFNNSGSGIDSGDRTCFLPPYEFAPDDPDTLYYGTHKLYRSTNNGQSWTAITGDVAGGSAAIRAIAVSKADPNYIYISTTGEKVLVSSDGGNNFEVVLEGSPGFKRVSKELGAAPWDAKTAYKAGGHFGVDHVLVTRDAGATWTAIDGDLPDIPTNAVVAFRLADDTEIVLVGTDWGVYLTCNEDGHWRKVGESLPTVVVNDVRYEPHFERIVAGTMGRGAWTFGDATEAWFAEICADTDDDDDDDGDDDDAGDDDDDDNDDDDDDGDDDDAGGDDDDAGDDDDDAGDDDDDSAADDDDDDDDASGEEHADDGDASGCGCTVTGWPGWSGPLVMLGALGLMRRRRRGHV